MTKLNRLSLIKIILVTFNIFLTFIPNIFGNIIYNVNISHYNIPRTQILKLDSDSIKIIVIDPGHGGKDNGTSYEAIREKNITLKIAKLLKSEIEEKLPGTLVLLTRDSDKFIPLYQRVRLANRSKADLFISIHCNSYKHDHSVHGSEVFTLGLTDSEENLDVAMRENASVLFEGDYENNYEWHDPNSIEAYIFLSAFQNFFLDKSVVLANKMSKSIQDNSKMKDRGVKQSGFVILKYATMPSILVETGFLSNKEDREKLTSINGQKQIAEGIGMAIVEYFLK